MIIEAGYNKPIRTASKQEIRRILKLHYTLFRNKSCMDQLKSGLAALGVLDAMAQYSHILRPFFQCGWRDPLTAGICNIMRLVKFITCSVLETLLQMAWRTCWRYTTPTQVHHRESRRRQHICCSLTSSISVKVMHVNNHNYLCYMWYMYTQRVNYQMLLLEKCSVFLQEQSILHLLDLMLQPLCGLTLLRNSLMLLLVRCS